jgi:hypothetical protein
MPSSPSSRIRASLTRAARYGSRVRPEKDEELDLTRREAQRMRQMGVRKKAPKFGQKPRSPASIKRAADKLRRGR